MIYKTSKDYNRLIRLIDSGEHIIVIYGCCSYFACYDKYKGYYVGYSWLEHDIEFSEFANKDVEAFKDFCEDGDVGFIDPADYLICDETQNTRFYQLSEDIDKMAELLIEQTSLDIRYPTYEVRPIGIIVNSKKKALSIAKKWLMEKPDGGDR